MIHTWICLPNEFQEGTSWNASKLSLGFRFLFFFFSFVHNYSLHTLKLIVQWIHLSHGFWEDFIPPNLKCPRIKRSFNISVKQMLFAIIWRVVKQVGLVLKSIFHIEWGKSETPLNEIIQSMSMGNWTEIRFKCLYLRELTRTHL